MVSGGGEGLGESTILPWGWTIPILSRFPLSLSPHFLQRTIPFLLDSEISFSLEPSFSNSYWDIQSQPYWKVNVPGLERWSVVKNANLSCRGPEFSSQHWDGQPITACNYSRGCPTPLASFVHLCSYLHTDMCIIKNKITILKRVNKSLPRQPAPPGSTMACFSIETLSVYSVHPWSPLLQVQVPDCLYCLTVVFLTKKCP